MGRVTAVVCAAFSPNTDAQIYAVRDAVRGLGIALPPRPPHRPHFSLAAARVEQGEELAHVLTVAAGVAREHVPIKLTLDEVGRFGRAGALWLGPSDAREVGSLQADVAHALAEADWPPAFGERSDPTQWVAHCTLATRVPKPQLRAVQTALREAYRPIDATVDALATILVGGRGDVGHVLLA